MQGMQINRQAKKRGVRHRGTESTEKRNTFVGLRIVAALTPGSETESKQREDRNACPVFSVLSVPL
jgi:hypothetical protein